MTRFRLLLIALGLLVTGACGSTDDHHGTPPDGAAPDQAGNPSYDLTTVITDGGVETGVFTASIGPILVPQGQEVVRCSIVQLTNTVAIDVIKMETTLAFGSHHLIAYRSSQTTAQPPTPCSSFDGVTKGEAPLFIAESKHSVMQLPSAAAYHLNAGQFVRLEAHYINTTQSDLMGSGTIAFTAGAAGNYQAADIMMCGSALALTCNAGGGLTPGLSNTSLPPGFYKGGGTVDFTKLKIFAFTSHEHHRGTDVKVWKSTSNGANPNPPIFDNTSWDNPPLQSYTDSNLLTFGPGEGLEWQCSYDTSADSQKVCFGESANDEMCFIWAYYYPSVGRFISETDCWFN